MTGDDKASFITFYAGQRVFELAEKIVFSSNTMRWQRNNRIFSIPDLWEIASESRNLKHEKY